MLLLLRLFVVVGILAVSVTALYPAEDYELYSDLTDDRWVLDARSLVPVQCPDEGCPPATFTDMTDLRPIHKIKKRSVVKIDSMKDYIKFLLRGNKTRDDDRPIDPYVTGNITLGNWMHLFQNKSV